MSEVKVNKISPRLNCGTITVGDAGDAVSVTAGVPVTVNGDLKSNALKAVDGGNIVNQCGTTITLGASGDTIQLACGASQTGFGRTGTVDWDTTAKTASFTAVSGNGYFVNTTSSAITLTLPATPSAGDIVAFKDYAFTFGTNALTVDGNGSPIGGVDGTINPTYNTDGTSKTFIYVDGTKGWLVVNESTDTSQEVTALFTSATGGTEVTCGDYKTHIFTGPGTFTVTQLGNGPTVPSGGPQNVEYLVVAGGGGGTPCEGGGAGGGGLRTYTSLTPATPINACAALPVSVTAYPITIGGGGSVGSPSARGTNGTSSVFDTITSAGGGTGGSKNGCRNGAPGGSGGGGGGRTTGAGSGGTGNTPPVAPPQGQPGAPTTPTGPSYGGGGGGAIAGGSNSNGGDGTFIPTGFIGPTSPSYGETGPSGRYFSGGGGGRQNAPSPSSNGLGGLGGGGTSVWASPAPGAPATGGTNTGGGGGNGGNGGSGIVIIRYKYQ